MKVYQIAAVVFCALFVFASPLFSEETRFVEIRKPFVPVYQKLDPESKIIKQVSKNDHLELVYEGTSWYQVTVDGKTGWVEKGAGIVVDNPGKTILSVPAGTFIFFVLLLLGSIGVAISIVHNNNRQRLEETI